MQDSSKAQLDVYKEELEALALRWGNDAKGKAERILNTSLSASKTAMGKVMEEGVKATAASIHAEIDAALASVVEPIRAARRIGALNVVALWVTLR